MFHVHHHGNGELANDGYVLVHGSVMRILDEKFQQGEFKVEDYTHQVVEEGGKSKTVYNALIDGQCLRLESKTTYDGGILGGGVTGFSDFSITRNVFTMLLTFVILFLIFRIVAKQATRTVHNAPKGLQNFIEPFYTFIRDEVAKPNIGPKYEKYMPYLLSAFFFILGLNLIGQIPFFPGGANVTGNISITIVLALITFLISTFSANKHFWEHTLWMPGVPAVLKIFILTPIEILGVFLKPFTLLLRLFANITAGHIVILSFVSLIFILGKAGESVGGAAAGAAASIPLTLFMMTLELLVAFLQAFIFTMLSATYIGTAIEEPHHDHH
ncbi:MAG TPA: ATP synthase F0 subunit A [Saprospirales bacterium]|nr:ATP synthase F0 subunit A [Saprospirales bacterium]